jgi:hypothetical protein
MDIIEALSRQSEPKSEPKVRQVHNGQLTMHDDIFKMQLQELNLADDIIDDLMLEPVIERDNYLHYFRARQ